jgi:hypothetical protein
MYLKTKTIKCPECGSPVPCGNFSEISTCSHCNTPLLIKVEGDNPEYFIKANIDLMDTTAILISRLRHFLIAGDFIKNSRIITRSILCIPFYYITGLRCGEHIIEETDRYTDERRIDTKVLQSSFKYSTLASRLPGLNKLNINLEKVISDGVPLIPGGNFNHNRNEILIRPDALIDPESFITHQFNTHNEKIKSDIIIENCVVIYYPIIRVVLKYRTNIYHFSIDGLNGDILYGIAPESINIRFIPMAVSAFFTSLFSGGIINFISKSILSGAFAIWIMIIPVFISFIMTVFFFIYVAYIFYKNHGEIVIVGNRIEVNKLNIPEETKVERFFKPIFNFMTKAAKKNQSRFR